MQLIILHTERFSVTTMPNFRHYKVNASLQFLSPILKALAAYSPDVKFARARLFGHFLVPGQKLGVTVKPRGQCGAMVEITGHGGHWMMEEQNPDTIA